MTELVEYHEHPELTDPVLIVSLEGWIDAGVAAASAMVSLIRSTSAANIASFDADRLLDHRARRPIMHLVNGLITGLDWPGTELHAGVDSNGRDVLLLHGAEPDFEWSAFTGAVLELIEDYECSRVVYLGAYPAPVPHTRPVNLALTTSSVELSEQLRGYVRGSLDVPAGIHTVLDVEANKMGVPTLGLWAQIPHYISSMPYPAASLALLEGLHDLADLSFDVKELAGEVAETRDRLDRLVAENPEHLEMVRQLENVVDTAGPTDEIQTPLTIGEIPSGDELAEEFQRFLEREQGPDED
ncbi:MAG: PAC2 family protein [Microthrixaceae bacterium]|nr:PAC2 family protein [Microthrixaceae bacterium]MCB9387469.1 PAC2 family protein [Microthrixaceae bacterium]MCO5322003.1 PAC2 family protein [Microthrixaceae bacterium]